MPTPAEKIKIDPRTAGLENLAILINEANARGGVTSNYTMDSFEVVGILEIEEADLNTAVWLRGKQTSEEDSQDGLAHDFTGEARFTYTRVDLGTIVLAVPEPHLSGSPLRLTAMSSMFFMEACDLAGVCRDQLNFTWRQETPPVVGEIRELVATPKPGVENVLYKPGTELVFKVLVQPETEH